MSSLRYIRVVALLLLTLAITSCRSNRIPSRGAANSYETRRSAVMSLLSESEDRMSDVRTYEVKNAKAKVDFNGNKVSLKANVKFTRGEQITVTGRMQFPPINVGKVVVDKGKASITSKVAGIDKNVKIPDYLGEALQCALLGIVPPLYEIYGEKDFSKFDIEITEDGCYELSRDTKKGSVVMKVNAQDYTLVSLKAVMYGTVAEMKVTEYKTFDGRSLPTEIEVVAREGSKKPASMTINISDPKINK